MSDPVKPEREAELDRSVIDEAQLLLAEKRTSLSTLESPSLRFRSRC